MVLRKLAPLSSATSALRHLSIRPWSVPKDFPVQFSGRRTWLEVSLTLDTMAQRTAIKTTYEVNRTIQPIYAGGSVALSEDGRILAACVGDDALLTDLTTGQELARIEGVRSPNLHLALC